MASTLSPRAPAAVESDLVAATVIVKMTAAERRFIERQSRAELRTISNYVRSLVIERMSMEA
jgi:hypothetical protein